MKKLNAEYCRIKKMADSVTETKLVEYFIKKDCEGHLKKRNGDKEKDV